MTQTTQLKIGMRVKYIGLGRYWRDTGTHERVGTIINIQPMINNICIEYLDTKGKKHIENIQMNCPVQKILEVLE